jgi:ketosteroid isomerase-like protein
MTTRHVIDSFWSAMQANEWTAAAEHFADDCLIDWPCSGERVRSPQAYAELQARYPTDTGVWSFDIHQIVCEGDTAVSEVTVSDGEQAPPAT